MTKYIRITKRIGDNTTTEILTAQSEKQLDQIVKDAKKEHDELVLSLSGVPTHSALRKCFSEKPTIYNWMREKQKNDLLKKYEKMKAGYNYKPFDVPSLSVSISAYPF